MLVRGDGVASEELEFEYQPKAEAVGKRPMVLDPYSFLKLQKVLVDETASDADGIAANSLVLELGLSTCADCKGCRCGVGIDLKAEVIQPLLESNELIAQGSHWQRDAGRKQNKSLT